MDYTLVDIRNLIQVPACIVDDDILVRFSADEVFPSPVGIAISLDNKKRLVFFGFSPQLRIPSDKITDAVMFCNEYNKNKAYLSVYVDTKDKCFYAHYLADTDGASEAWVKNTVNTIIALTCYYFIDAGKKF